MTGMAYKRPACAAPFPRVRSKFGILAYSYYYDRGQRCLGLAPPPLGTELIAALRSYMRTVAGRLGHDNRSRAHTSSVDG